MVMCSCTVHAFEYILSMTKNKYMGIVGMGIIYYCSGLISVFATETNTVYIVVQLEHSNRHEVGEHH